MGENLELKLRMRWALAFFEAIGKLTTLLPASVSHAFGRVCGRAAWLACPRERRIGIAQATYVAQKRPTLTRERTPEGIVRASFAHLGQSVAELFTFHKLLTLEPGSENLPTGPFFKHIRATGSELCAHCRTEKRPILRSQWTPRKL